VSLNGRGVSTGVRKEKNEDATKAAKGTRLRASEDKTRMSSKAMFFKCPW